LNPRAKTFGPEEKLDRCGANKDKGKEQRAGDRQFSP
jgi:hypothetical protein